MRTSELLSLGFCIILPLLQSSSTLQPDPPHVCDSCDAWNKPRAPHRIFGNSFYVGTDGLSAVLITSNEGHVLIDGALQQSAPLIDQSIRQLGFKTSDVKYILNSHPHYDHAGGIAALQRFTGATVLSSPHGIGVLGAGAPGPDDPQYGYGQSMKFPPVKNLRAIKDGETLRLGDIAITAHHTPGHTPGGVTWAWRSCEGSDCKSLVFADSLTAVSAPGFRYTADPAHPSRIDEFRRTIAKVAALPCDIVIAAHPQASVGKTCATLAADAAKRLDQRIAEERKAP